jgi:integrase/recombinase XerD
MAPAEHADQADQRRLAEQWLESQRSANTRAAYRIDLDTFGAWCAARGSIPLRADAATIVAFQAAREAAGDSPATLRRRWSALSSFYDFVLERDGAASNPTHGASRPRVADGDASPTAQLSAETVAAYRAAAAALDPRLDALVALLVADGLKLGEVLALDVGDIGGRAPRTTVTIRRRGASKRIVLHPDSARSVRRCIGRRMSGPLLTGRGTSNGKPRRLTRFGADHLIRQLTADGDQRVTANELRRFHITSGLDTDTDTDSDTDLERVREKAGLADVRSVKRYLRQ